MDKIKQLQAIIDELQLESRKIEFSSEVERLKRRVQALEEQIDLIKIILQDVSKR